MYLAGFAANAAPLSEHPFGAVFKLSGCPVSIAERASRTNLVGGFGILKKGGQVDVPGN